MRKVLRSLHRKGFAIRFHHIFFDTTSWALTETGIALAKEMEC